MNQFVLAITGPSGAGKTSTGEKLAKRLDRCVNIDADHIKHMIVSGFYKDDSPGGWGFNQWELVGDSIGLLAANFQKEGYSVVINGYIDEPAWVGIEEHLTITHKVLLLPQLDTVVNRDSGRHDDVVMGKVAVAQHHDIFSTADFYRNFKELDTTNHSVDETVDSVLAMLT